MGPGAGTCLYCNKGQYSACDVTNPSDEQRKLYGRLLPHTSSSTRIMQYMQLLLMPLSWLRLLQRCSSCIHIEPGAVTEVTVYLRMDSKHVFTHCTLLSLVWAELLHAESHSTLSLEGIQRHVLARTCGVTGRWRRAQHSRHPRVQPAHGWLGGWPG